jgi:hypothetical protein
MAGSATSADGDEVGQKGVGLTAAAEGDAASALAPRVPKKRGKTGCLSELSRQLVLERIADSIS